MYNTSTISFLFFNILKMPILKLIKIPKYVPFFLINWLEGLKIMSSGHGLLLFTRLKLQEVLLYSGIYLCFLLVYYYTN